MRLEWHLPPDAHTSHCPSFSASFVPGLCRVVQTVPGADCSARGAGIMVRLRAQRAQRRPDWERQGPEGVFGGLVVAAAGHVGKCAGGEPPRSEEEVRAAHHGARSTKGRHEEIAGDQRG